MSPGASWPPLDAPRELIQFVPDRPGHDRRYAMDSGLIRALGWEPETSFAEGLEADGALVRGEQELVAEGPDAVALSAPAGSDVELELAVLDELAVGLDVLEQVRGDVARSGRCRRSRRRRNS